eukprot:CAMPEP_0194278736 /NCGR_PEP_ID=MMETSP0169-20130528/12002_1 /TAXON_ID=218684 /ORGANISM="Corethron pennatum, Strain L29A3" /LENGTH=165 /DNA_ID=CAMNT_0039022995 /DNA_START=51 /DNA_END=548 /DNA_ORIENTATION=+
MRAYLLLSLLSLFGAPAVGKALHSCCTLSGTGGAAFVSKMPSRTNSVSHRMVGHRAVAATALFLSADPDEASEAALFEDPIVPADAPAGDGAAKLSLEEKMLAWEATDEEKRASTLGGVMPSSDGFDVGLWIMFPFIVATSLLFFVFPFIMDKIDVSSVGPPPMV